jgi:hypothetical protein
MLTKPGVKSSQVHFGQYVPNPFGVHTCLGRAYPAQLNSLLHARRGFSTRQIPEFHCGHLAECFIPEEFDLVLFSLLPVKQQSRTEAHYIEKDLHDIHIGIWGINFNKTQQLRPKGYMLKKHILIVAVFSTII